ncbi:MAG TPA: hypothetical protein [Caudoviricetes sp.]|nr:MAG TPA: hypothetical protein [Caudoviricetes sp.]
MEKDLLNAIPIVNNLLFCLTDAIRYSNRSNATNCCT